MKSFTLIVEFQSILVENVDVESVLVIIVWAKSGQVLIFPVGWKNKCPENNYKSANNEAKQQWHGVRSESFQFLCRIHRNIRCWLNFKYNPKPTYKPNLLFIKCLTFFFKRNRFEEEASENVFR